MHPNNAPRIEKSTLLGYLINALSLTDCTTPLCDVLDWLTMSFAKSQ